MRILAGYLLVVVNFLVSLFLIVVVWFGGGLTFFADPTEATQRTSQYLWILTAVFVGIQLLLVVLFIQTRLQKVRWATFFLLGCLFIPVYFLMVVLLTGL